MHLLQVGAGSGGIVVLDLLARDPRISRITLIEPDIYKPHNIHRHIFPPQAVGRRKVDLAVEWVRERRPDLEIVSLATDITDPASQPALAELAAGCDLGVCAVDNERAKFAFDSLLRTAGKPWTLGEVLSGGIGGWVHRFTPSGPCYGCVASHLQRTVTEEPQAPAPDYSAPDAAVAETTIPASKASIGVIAGLHAVATLQMLVNEPTPEGEYTSMLFTLQRVPGVFEEAFRPFRFRIAKSASCLICSVASAPTAGEDLDVALDQALDRLGNH